LTSRPSNLGGQVGELLEVGYEQLAIDLRGLSSY